MKTLLTSGRTLATMLLLGIVAPAGAQSLGVPRADAWIGRPLELTVPARFSGGDTGDQCVHADVFYGDTRLPPGQVKATVVGTGDQRRVRVEAAPVIDEPVVTVAVRTGCGSTFSRSYTLLPELASEQVLAAATARSVQPGGILTTALPTQAVGAGAAPARGPIVRSAMASAGDTPPRMRAARPARVQEALGTARLRLASFEGEAQQAQQAMLRVSAQLAEPLGDAARRVTASLLWQALNASPTDLIRTTALVLKLENELAQLQQTSTQTRAEVQALRRELQSPAATTGSKLTQLLALLVLLAGGTTAYLWFRNRSAAQGAWTGAPLDAGDSMLDSQLPPQRATPEAPQQPPQPMRPQAPARFAPAARPAQPAPSPSPSMPLDADLSLDDLPSGFSALPAQPAPVSGLAPLEFDLSDDAAFPGQAATPTMMRVETLAATFEEVEFLSTLGLWNDAMDILKTYLEDSEAPAPIAFFELMRLYVHTDDAASLVSVRKRYQKVFGVEAPKFDHITSAAGLEGFPDLAMRVTRAWGTPQVLDHIEQYLFAVPQPGRAFSLQAGRDLLYLHHLAMDMLNDRSAQGATDDAEAHEIAPWASAESPAQARMAAERAAEVSGGHNFALDFDLSAQPEELPEPQQNLKNPNPDPARKPEPVKPLDDVEDAFSAAMSRETRRPTRF